MQSRATSPDMRGYFGYAAVNVVTLSTMVDGHHLFSRYYKDVFLIVSFS